MVRKLGTAELVTAVEHRIQFRDLKDVLKARGTAAKAGGWKQLIAEIEDDPSKGATLLRLLTDVYTQTTLAGSKELSYFELDDGDLETIGKAFQLMVSTGAYADAFPMPVSETQLAAMDSDHKLAKVLQRDNGDVSLVFCAKRSANDKKEMQITEFGDAVRKSFPKANRVVFISTLDYQVFDVVNFRKQLKRIEILIDQPERALDKDDLEDRALSLLGLLSTSCEPMRNLYENNTPSNLYYCIAALYDNKREGRIQKMAFRAPSKSMKKETVNPGDDLRKEEYHEAGVEKVGAISPYDITISWENINGFGPASMRIHAPVSSISTGSANVRTARLLEARDDHAVVSVVNKLVSHST